MVKDTVVNQQIGTFTDWRMTLWGESIDPQKAVPYPMPTDFDDDHDEDDDASPGTAPVIVGTTSISVPTSTDLSPNPSDHIDRPVNSKIGPSATVTSSATLSTSTSAATSTSSSTTSATASASPDSFLPSIFPTFGVSPKTQIWIYGAIAAIIIFCIALGAFFCVWRRRRARTSRADYEFEMVNDEDVDGAGQPLNGEGVRRKRRGGELYDAFAGESDEEIFSEAEEQYKDEPEQDEKAARRGKKEGEGGMSEK